MTKVKTIQVPVQWLKNLAHLAEIAKKDKQFINHLIGYASNAETILKYGQITETKI